MSGVVLALSVAWRVHLPTMGLKRKMRTMFQFAPPSARSTTGQGRRSSQSAASSRMGEFMSDGTRDGDLDRGYAYF